MRFDLRRGWIVFLVLALVAIVHSPPVAVPQGSAKADVPRGWPMFGGSPQRNMVNLVEKNVPSAWKLEWDEDSDPDPKTGLKKIKSQQNIKWVARLGSGTYGGLAIAGGKIFVGTTNKYGGDNRNLRDPKVKGDKGILMCFRAADGQFLWQIVHEKLPNKDENDFEGIGITSTSAIEGERVYYVSNRCEIVCADTNGKVLWTYDMIKELGVFPRQASSSAPLVGGDLVFAVTGNGVDDNTPPQLPAPKAPSFVAVHKTTGKLVWSSNLPGEKILNGQWTNPAYAIVNGKPQVIFPGGDGWLYGFEATSGKLIWKFDCNPKDAEWKGAGRGTRNYFVATPVVYDNKVYIGVGQDPDSGTGVGHLWCIDITKTGDVSPELVVDEKAKPVKTRPNPASALVWHYGGPILPRPERGRDVVFGRTVSTVAVHDGLLWAAELDGYLHCLDARTGKKYWDHDLKASVWASPYWVDNKIYLGTDEGDMLIFAHGKEKKLLNTIEMGRPIKGTPAVVDGVLYLATDSYLHAIASK